MWQQIKAARLPRDIQEQPGRGEDRFQINNGPLSPVVARKDGQRELGGCQGKPPVRAGCSGTASQTRARCPTLAGHRGISAPRGLAMRESLPPGEGFPAA